MDQPKGELKYLDPASLDTSFCESHRQAQHSTLEYAELSDSVKKEGVLQTVLVREVLEGDEIKYYLIDGIQRVSAAIDAGLTEIPCNVIECTEAKAISWQVQLNLQRIPPTTSQYAHALKTMLKYGDKSIGQLAEELNTTVAWIKKQLKLIEFESDIQLLFDNGKISAANAIELAKIPASARNKELIQAAMEKRAKDFAEIIEFKLIQMRKKKVQQTKEDIDEETFEPKFRFRKRAEIETELRVREFFKYHNLNFNDQEEAFYEGIKWAVMLDTFTKKKRKESFLSARHKEEQRRKEQTRERLEARLEEMKKQLTELKKEK